MSRIVSIIMPVYGVEKYIDKAIQSVRNQTYADWELLIVNDGSKDNSREIAKRYMDIDKRIKVLDKSNGGLSDARNYGLRHAIGHYIHFFDSDDYIEPDFYERLVNAMSDDSNSVIICGYTVDNEDRRTEHSCFDYVWPINKSVIYPTEEDIITRYINFAWNKLYHRSFLVENHLEFEKGLSRIEDAEFFDRVFPLATTLKFIRYSGYHYVYRNEPTLSKLLDNRILDDFKRAIDLYRKKLLYLGYSETERLFKYRCFLSVHCRAFLNLLFSNYPNNGVVFYKLMVRDFLFFLKEKEVASLEEDKTIWGKFFTKIVRYRLSFVLHKICVLRNKCIKVI